MPHTKQIFSIQSYCCKVSHDMVWRKVYQLKSMIWYATPFIGEMCRNVLSPDRNGCVTYRRSHNAHPADRSWSERSLVHHHHHHHHHHYHLYRWLDSRGLPLSLAGCDCDGVGEGAAVPQGGVQGGAGGGQRGGENLPCQEVYRRRFSKGDSQTKILKLLCSDINIDCSLQ